MRPEIEAYLRENGPKYTTKALRAQLTHAGYDATEVDGALQETEAIRAPQFAKTRALRSRFWWWAIVLHVAVLVVVGILVLNHGRGSYFQMYLTGVVVVLGPALLIGLGISGLIGRTLLGRGVAVALVVPLISALVLGGSCLAISGTVTI